MDRWDYLEFAGILLLAVFAAFLWMPAAFGVLGVALIVEAQLRSLKTADVTEDGAE